MRKLLISLLLASAAATPALADPDHSDKHAARVEHQAPPPREAPARTGPPVQLQRPQFQGSFAGPPGPPPQHFSGAMNGGEPRAVNSQRFQQNGDASPGARNWRGPRHEQVVGGDQPNAEVMQERRERFDGNTSVQSEPLRHLDRPLPPVMRTRTPVVSSVPRPGTMPPPRVDEGRREQIVWNRDWRRDQRYDWRWWRERHRDRFRIAIYYDPFGWGYQPYEIGWRLWPNYYSANYWINDPWDYQLPYAPPGTQWVRYYNDVLLVDMYTGEVIDVIHDFFW